MRQWQNLPEQPEVELPVWNTPSDLWPVHPPANVSICANQFLVPGYIRQGIEYMYVCVSNQITCLLAEMKMTSRCSPCPTSGWWCWRSQSPTFPLTPSTQRRMETTLTLHSWISLFQTRCHTPAPGSQHRWSFKPQQHLGLTASPWY